MSELSNDELLVYVRAEASQARIASTHDKIGEKLWLKRAKAFEQIVALINKPQVTEELIEKKADEMHDFVDYAQNQDGFTGKKYISKAKDFLRSFAEEVMK